MTILQAVLLCVLLAALIRIPAESGPRGAVVATYLLVVIVVIYVLTHGAVRW